MRKTVAVAFIVGLLGVLPESGIAHSDTDLRLHFGKIIGLPEQYTPASFDRRKFVLTLGEQRYEFPEFLIDLIRSQEGGYRISMHGSWYDGHHYIALDFHRRKNDGYSCSFGLEDLSKISVTKDTPLGRDSYRTDHVNLTEEQNRALEDGLKTPIEATNSANKEGCKQRRV